MIQLSSLFLTLAQTFPPERHDGAEALGGVIACMIFPCLGLCGVLGLALWIWALIEVLTKEPSEGNDKVIWLIVVLLTSWLGALIYLLVRRPQRKRQFGR